MDVNKANAVSPLGQGGQRKDQKRGADEGEQHDQENPDGDAAGGSPWEDSGAVDVAGLLAGALSPEAQKAFESLAREIEPLRAEVDRARGREAHFRELAEKHSFLPLPGRREFLRELSQVLGHMAHLTPPPSLVVMHLVNADAIRRRFGRRALDGVLTHVCAAIETTLQPTDIAGSIGGNDFGVILLAGDQDQAAEMARHLVDAVSGQPFAWKGDSVALEAEAGVASLGGLTDPEAALDLADRDLVGRLAAPAAGGPETPSGP